VGIKRRRRESLWWGAAWKRPVMGRCEEEDGDGSINAYEIRTRSHG
jgi:hypothetical protein